MMVAISHPQGDTFRRFYKITDFDMETARLHGLTIWITVKSMPDNDPIDATARIRHVLVVDEEGVATTSIGIRIGGVDPETMLPVEGAESGVFTHFVTHEESNALVPGSYVYDVQIMTSHVPPVVKTVIEDAPWVVRGDVTRRTTPDGGPVT